MRRLIASLFAFLLILGVTAAGPQAADKIRVVTTIPDLKALTEEVGGDLVEVESLARGTQNAHELEIRPSLMLKLRRADVLIENGLELDTWADVAVQGANNGKIIRGAAGRIDASRGVQVLDVPAARVDRSMGDVHPLGNPHYSLDPGQAPVVTANIVEGLARLAPEHRATFEKNRRAFLARLDEAMARWTKLMEPFKGAKVVVYHADLNYFLARFGLIQAGTVEERAGIPPSPSHLTRLIRQIREERIKAVIVQPWSDAKLAARAAEDGGARTVTLSSMVGGVRGADSYIATIDYNVNALAQALR